MFDIEQRFVRIWRKFNGDGRCDFCNLAVKGIVYDCGQCERPNYCSPKCQQQDLNRRHRKDCWELRMIKRDYSELHRRVYLVPNHKEKLALLMSYHTPFYCSKCNTHSPNKKLKLCAGCSVARYCSKKCQIEDWTCKHRDDCREICRSRSILCGVKTPEQAEEEVATNVTHKHGMFQKQLCDMDDLVREWTREPLIDYSEEGSDKSKLEAKATSKNETWQKTRIESIETGNRFFES